MPHASREPVLIYDGECGLCLAWVGRFRRWAGGAALRFLPLQDREAETLSGRTREELEHAMCLVLPDGRVLDGARAAAALLRYGPGWMGPLASVVMNLPGVRSAADLVYRRVAAGRNRAGCTSGACRPGVGGSGRSR